jgi:hypothetical protein
MNKSYSKIRHIQNSNILLENKLLLEQQAYDMFKNNNISFMRYQCTWNIPVSNKNKDIKADNENKVYLYPNGTYISYKDADDESKVTDPNYSTGTFSCIVNRIDNTQKIKLTPKQQDTESSDDNEENKADTPQTSPGTQQPVTNTAWVGLPTRVSTIQKTLNITPSSQMDQATINAIMTNLGGNNVTNVEKKEPSQTGTSTSSEA